MIYEDILREFELQQVRYVVVGGVAVNLYGYARLTVDLDVMIDLAEENLFKVVSIMDRLGYKPRVPVKPGEIISPAKRNEWIEQKGAVVFTFVHLDRPYRHLDIFLNNPIDFEKAYSRSKIFQVGNVKIRVASIEDLIAMKQVSKRPRDLEDIGQLQKLNELIRAGKNTDDS